jgi:hypothetical protein
VLPPDIPIDFFTPEFYNSLTVKEHARYTETGVAFLLLQYAFNKSHVHWLMMGKSEFMKAYGNEVLAQYHVPSAEEITELHSDADDEEEEVTWWTRTMRWMWIRRTRIWIQFLEFFFVFCYGILCSCVLTAEQYL